MDPSTAATPATRPDGTGAREHADHGERDDKRLWRHRIRATRRVALPGRDREADGRAIAAAFEPLLPEVSCAAVYLSLPTEPPTGPLVEAMAGHGIRVLVPLLLEDRDLDWAELAHGRPGVPLGRQAIGTAQLVVAPALAVDPVGRRLGQGGGSYDRALARRAPGSLVVAVVNDEEYAGATVPHAAHDQPVDAVVTPGGGLVRFR